MKLNNKTIGIGLIVAGLILVILFVIRFWGPEDAWLCQDGVWVKHGNPDAGQPNVECKKGDKITASSPTALPKPKGTPLGIMILDPNLNAKISSPFVIKGSASAENFINNIINFKIIDKAGNVLGQGISKPGNKQADGNFAFETAVEFSNTQTGDGYIMINDKPIYKFPIQL